MIARLAGTLDSMVSGGAIVDVGGVGYLVFCSARTLVRLPAPGQPVSLIIETHVREDQISLYGFLDKGEREWFRLLTTVQGVGAKLALGILGVLPPDELALALAAQDRAGLTRASGVGPKLAARILTELKDKAGALELGSGEAAMPQPGGAVADAVSALVNLGYRRAEAYGAVAVAARKLGQGAAVDALIRAGLNELGR